MADSVIEAESCAGNSHISRFRSVLATACAALTVAATASARSITGISVTQSSSGEKRVNVALEVGAADDDHALYLAFDDADKGADPAAWASFQRVGRIGATAISASAVVSPLAAGSHTHCRAFLVDNALPYDTLVEKLRQTGTQWLDTGIRPDPTTFIEIYSRIDKFTSQNCLFGVCSDDTTAGLVFRIYENGSRQWAGACKNASVSGNWNSTGWSVSTDGVTCQTLDAAAGKQTLINTWTANSKTISHTASRTATSAGTLPLFAERYFASGADTIRNIVTGGDIHSCIISNNAALVRDFRPCSSNGRGAMFDAVSGEVFYSCAAEPFLAGGSALAAAPVAGESALSASAAVSLAAPESGARAIPAADYRTVSGVTNIIVNLAAGATGADHALYLAWDTADKGADMAAWSHFQRLGHVGADAGSLVIPASTNLLGQGFTVCRAFLVNDALPYDYATPLLRQNRKQWINTGVKAGPGTRTEMTLMMDNDTNEQRPFGVDSGNAAVGFSYALFVGNNDHYWYTCCKDGAGDYVRQGWSLPLTQYQTIGLDANDGLAAGYVFSVTNRTTGGNTRASQGNTQRTSTSAWPIALFARATRNYAAGTDTMAVDKFLEGAYIASCSIWDCEGLVRDYVPVSANGEGGFYDRVTGEVYFSAANSGVPTMYYGISGATVPTDVAPLVADGGPADCTPVASETMVAVSAAVDITVPHGILIIIR